jgi:hypothetical protein
MKIFLVTVAGLGLGSCVPLLVADAGSVGATGKPVHDPALSAVTDKDCRVMEGAIREDRKMCKEKGAPATERDLKSVMRRDDERVPVPKQKPAPPLW